MSTRSDPLAKRLVEGPDRVRYAQGVLLDARDFEDEQTYHRGRLARALKYLFGSGTAAGLEVTWRAATEEILVEPGLALDPLGRTIELLRPFCLRLRNWFSAQRTEDLRDGWLTEPAGSVLVADVFVRLTVCERGKTPAFASGPYDALDAVTAARLREAPELALVVRTEAVRVRGGTLGALPAPGATAEAAAIADEIAGAGGPQARFRPLQDRILAAWREGTDAWESDTQPARLPEHLGPRILLDVEDPTEVGRDPTSVLLARVRVPVDPPADASARPTDRGEAPTIDNFLRRFVYAAGVTTRPVLPPETP